MEGHGTVIGGGATPVGPVKPAPPDVQPPAPGEALETFRVLLPIAFPDGEVHRAGDVIQITVEQAKLYAHALVRVEGK